MQAPSALFFVLRSYLVQGLTAGAMSAVLMPTLIAKGMDLAQYSEQSALGLLPWCLKLVWAHPIDNYTRHHPNRLRRFVAISQLVIAVLILAMMSLLDIEHSRWGWGIFWLVVNTGLAAQDTATDAVAIHEIPDQRRSGANAAMQFGHALGATVIAGWLLGGIARNHGLAAMGLCLAGIFLGFGCLELAWSAKARGPGQPSPLAPEDPGVRAWHWRPFLWPMALAGTAMIGQGLTSTAAGPFLFSHLHWTVQDYQSELYPLSTAVTLLAYALGTQVLPRKSASWTFVRSGCAIGFLWLLLGLLQGQWAAGGHPLILSYAVFEAISTALWTASIYALLMRASQGRHRALAFAGLMALTNLSRIAGTLLTPIALPKLGFAGLWIAAGLWQIGCTLGMHARIRDGQAKT